jgi:hypothetical protein
VLTPIVTANVGGYDAATDPAARVLAPAPRPGEHPRSTAKRAKMLAWHPLPDAHYVIWIDANMRLVDERASWFRTVMATCCDDSVLACWAHPDRSTIAAEADASFVLAPEKYAGQPLREQVEHYRRVYGYRDDHGLYAGGALCWNLHNPKTLDVAAAWRHECERWSYQDQLSLPFVLWRFHEWPALLPFTLRDNPWVDILAHRSPT